MTTKQLAMAQYLLGVYERANQYGDEIDPKRTHKDILANSLDRIAYNAGHAFVTLTGKHPTAVTIFELSTIKPAPWAKKHKPKY